MSTLNPLIGINYARAANGLVAIEPFDMGVQWLLGTAADADNSKFPLNENVLLLGNDPVMRSYLGNRGTLQQSLDSMFDQGASMPVIICRIPSSPKPYTSYYQSIHRVLSEKTESITKSDSDFDDLGEANVNAIRTITQGESITYERDTDWTRVSGSSKIQWVRETVQEVIIKGLSATDILEKASTALTLVQVDNLSDTDASYIIGTEDDDVELSEFGITWLKNPPEPHSSLLVTYEVGKRPAVGSLFSTDYTYYTTNNDVSTVTRGLGDSDYLPYADVVRINAVTEGSKIYDSFSLNTDGKRIDWIPTETQETIIRGTGLDAPVNAADLVSSNARITDANDVDYIKETDWTLDASNNIDWSIGGSEPALGLGYTFTYSYIDRPAYGSIYTVDIDFEFGEWASAKYAIGGVSVDTSTFEGVHAAHHAYEQTGKHPEIVSMPGFSHIPAVTHELTGVLKSILAIAFVDGNDTSPGDALNLRKEYGSERLFFCDPWYKFTNAETGKPDGKPMSAAYAGMQSYVDQNYGFWYSPSNFTLSGVEGFSGYSVNEEFLGETSVSQHLRENEVNTFTKHPEGGFVTGGNRTTSNTLDYRFLPVVRVDDFLQKTITYGLQPFRDRPITIAHAKSIVASVNGLLRKVAESGAIVLGNEDPAFMVMGDSSQTSLPPGIIDLKLGKTAFGYNVDWVYPNEIISVTRYVKPEYSAEKFQQIATIIRG